MDADTSKKPWWRKRRWWAAGLLWLAALYPLSHGPVLYFVARETLPPAALEAYLPIGHLMVILGGDPDSPAAAVVEAHRSYLGWWREWGREAAPPAPLAPMIQIDPVPAGGEP